jgi:hypothetical protein
MIKSEDLLIDEIDGKKVILNLDKNIYLELNELGSLIWDLLDNKTEEEIINEISSVYDVDRIIAYNDYMEFISSLKNNNILV